MRPVSATVVRALALCWLLGMLGLAMPAFAQPRMWLERDRIALDETVTLNVQLDAQNISAMPDMVELGRNFRIVDQRTQQEVEWVNGSLTAQVSIQLTLLPLREGEIEIRSLWTGRDATPPLRLTVLPPRNPQVVPERSPAAAAPGQPVFIETRIDSETPYIQQSVGYTLRLYYPQSSQIDGRLDQDQPEGASLQKVGDDLQLRARIGNIDYTAVERRFLLIPERSGAISVPPARFRGHVLGLFDSLFDTNRQEITVLSKRIVLQVKPIPATAPQPWLPLAGLRMRYLETPQALRVGESETVTVEVVAEGAAAAQLPALMLQTGKTAQVFADPAQQDERFQQGRPQATIVRRFSILPSRDGTLRVVAPRIAWWDTRAGVARIASLPDLNLRVAPGGAGTAASATTQDNGTAADNTPGRAWSTRMMDSQDRWLWAGGALSLLWLGALFLGWRLWSTRAWSTRAGHPQIAAGPQSAQRGTPFSRTASQTLNQVLARGDRGEIARTLCALASPPAADLDALRERLVEPAQLAAVEALLRARWGRGDPAAAIAAVRIAFADGPHWRGQIVRAAPTLLPPLYPER